MTDTLLDCLCCGIVVSDHVCLPITEMPRGGGLELTDGMHLTIGGCAANVAVDLRRLGLRAGLAGKVGRDVFGRHIRESLVEAGVECRWLDESPTRPTAGTLVINVRGEDRRFIHCIGANAEFDGRQVSPELIGSCRAIYLGGYCLTAALGPEPVVRLFRAARDAGVATVLDVVIPGDGDYRSQLDPVLPWTDVFLPNTDEAELITGIDDPLRQAEVFHAAGAGTVVVTCGSEGAVLIAEEGTFRAGSYPVEHIDATGSGDAFAAGFIFGLLEAAGPTTCLRYGSALGASCVRKMGATTGVFTGPELKAFVADNRLKIETL